MLLACSFYMIGYIMIGFLVWLFGICPPLGWLWMTYVCGHDGKVNGLPEWWSFYLVPGGIISLALGVLVIGIIFIVKGI